MFQIGRSLLCLCIGIGTTLGQDDSNEAISATEEEEFAWECRFKVDNGKVDTCNLTLQQVSRYDLHHWRAGLAAEANWKGGPEQDADRDSNGGFAFFDVSRFSTPDVSSHVPKRHRAWMLSPVQDPTKAEGRCLRFKYNIQGLNVESLTLLRVDFLAKRPTRIPLMDQANIKTADQFVKEKVVDNVLKAVMKYDVGGFAGKSTQVSAQIVVGSKDRLARSANLDEHYLQTTAAWESHDVTTDWEEAHFTYSSPLSHVFIWQVTPKFSRHNINGSSSSNIFSDSRGYVAVDNISIKGGHCPGECNFNSGFCDFETGVDGDFAWSLGHGSQKSATGPLKDHESTVNQLGAGGYAYIDSGHPRGSGDVAILALKNPITFHDTSSAKCLEFHVNSFGTGMGNLRVYLPSTSSIPTDLSDDENEIEIFPNQDNTTLPRTYETNGDLTDLSWELVRPRSSARDFWNKARVTVPPPIEGHDGRKVVFEASVGEVGRGDFAVDSVTVMDGACPFHPESSSPPKSLSNLDCSFQLGLCKWAEVATSRSKVMTSKSEVRLRRSSPGSAGWRRVRGGQQGAPEGHTRLFRGETDSYAAFSSSSPLQSSSLASPIIRAADFGSGTRICLNFWFYMATNGIGGHGLGKLRVIHKYGNETDTFKTTIWSLTNHQRTGWKQAQVSFVLGEESRIFLEATSGVGLNHLGSSMIAVDDITVFEGECKTLPSSAVPSALDCDFSSSSDDSTWESVNPSATSDNRGLRRQDWKIANGEDGVGMEDHTFGVKNAGFAYFDTADNINVLTWLVSSAIESDTKHCLAFFFRQTKSQKTDHDSALRIKRQYQNGTFELLWQVSGRSLAKDANIGWKFGLVPMGTVEESTLVILEGSSKFGGFAIDDIKLTSGSDAENCKLRPSYQDAGQSEELSKLILTRRILLGR